MGKMSKAEKKRRSCSSAYPELPTEIMEEILSRLPVKSLMRFRCVSKKWKTLFNNPDFITKHMNNRSINPTHILVEQDGDLYTSEIDQCCTSTTQMMMKELPHSLSKEWSSNGVCRIKALCHGLVCVTFGNSPLQKVLLYNPSTRVWLLLPHDYYNFFHPSIVFSYFGLGFDPTTNVYKVVKVTYVDKYVIGTLKGPYVDIYTLGSQSWRRIHNSSFPFLIKSSGSNAYVSGAVHWVVIPDFKTFPDGPDSIVSFDFSREVFQEVPLPAFTLKKDFFLRVAVLGGCLSVSANCFIKNEIWVMKEYGVKESWTKLFNICPVERYQQHRHTWPLVFFKDDEILLQTDGSELILYNPKNKKERKFVGFQGIPHSFNCVSYVESLFCPRVGRGGA